MDAMIKQAVIIAGGLGTRLKPYTETNPKPMYPFEGIPFIEYLVKQIKEFGIYRILILVGYLPEKIINYLGDGSQYGLQITYDITPIEYETGKRIVSAKDKIDNEFLFMYCDNYCPIDYWSLLYNYQQNGAWIQLTAYANREGYTKNNLKIGKDGLVELYDKQRQSDSLQGVDIGYAIVNKKVLGVLTEGNVNFEACVYPQIVKNKKMYATVCEHRYYSIGSWERIELTKQFFRKKKVIFLDRDGTLNVKPPKACYVENVKSFHWIKGAREAVKELKENNYFIILISNQPGIARGNLNEQILSEIHEKMQSDLYKVGAGIDAIYYCPHNWDEGCFCRKPNPGMLFQAQRDYSLNLKECKLIGDDERDMEAAARAGMQGILVDDQYTILDAVNSILYKETK